ncbi:hypothetical protein ACR3H8_34100, partial [Pseudomonas aeruginosa]|uniref:hypothetical protein n=1 Tax=Pseudomonas aeruginosa TaxID=287 RepID=UPI003D9C7707
ICCHPFEDDSLNYPVVTVSKGGSTITAYSTGERDRGLVTASVDACLTSARCVRGSLTENPGELKSYSTLESIEAKGSIIILADFFMPRLANDPFDDLRRCIELGGRDHGTDVLERETFFRQQENAELA